jgi:hypothetical protein
MLDSILSVQLAEDILNEAEQMNPGPWAMHSKYVGLAAKHIAEACPQLDSDKAYTLGLLHDIGRRCGIASMRHSIDGYNYCMERGFEDAAKVCLTHSFPAQDINEAFGKWDCSDDEYNFATDYIRTVQYDDYDLLIHLCDALALPSGFCLLEKRMIDVALRHGIHEYIIPKWKKTFEIKDYFDQAAGKTIYDLLPGIAENTFT